ncbi:MAG: hypothetical protein PHH85_10205 [Candidatus Methanoperedens sp.]|nr:hypothetical protein [Candidatus Methanoperedens sp.]
MIPELKFFEAFVELFNINASLMIIILCAHVLLKTYKLDRGFLKARLFLNSNVLQQIWISISIAGAAFALNSLLRLVGVYLTIKDIIYNYYLIEFSQMIFLISFIYAVIIWYQFINKTNNNDYSSVE